MPLRERPLHVVVVGAGLGGLATAIAIAQAGHRVTILEGGKGLAEIGAGIQLGPQTINVFKRWGIAEELAAKSVITPRCLLIRYTGERVLAEEPDMAGWLESRFGSPLYALHRTDVQDTLYRFALSLGVDVRFGAWVSTIDGETGQVTLKSGEVIAGDLIVGADGLNSLARSSLVGRPDPAVPTGELAYRVVLETDALKDDPELYDYAVTRKAIRIYYGPDAHVVVYTLSAGKQLNMVIAVPDDLPPEVARQKGDVAEMRALFKDWDDILKRLLAKVDSVDKWRLRSHPGLPSWHHPSGKLVLIGDAVHPMLPYLAQGANSAVMDGCVLGECLRRIDSPDELLTALATFERIIKPRGETIVKLSLRQRYWFNLHDGPEQEARDARLAEGCTEAQEAMGDFPFLYLDTKVQGFVAGFDPYKATEEEWERVAKGTNGIAV